MSLHFQEMLTHTGCLCEVLAPTVDRYDPGTIVAKLLTDALASFGVEQALWHCQRLALRSACRWSFPTRQSFIATLRVLMTKAMHVAQPRRLALTIVDVPLLDESLICRDQ